MISSILETMKDAMPTTDDFRREVIEGLSGVPKLLPCKYFYDLEGSRLFDQICELDEYYPTRTEQAIMEENAREIAEQLGPEVRLVEFGSGSSRKVRLLLDNLESMETYIPLDISKDHLAHSISQLMEDYPDLTVHPICADYLSDWHLPERKSIARKTAFYFPGSTIGNFHRPQALRFLQRIVEKSEQEDLLLIGVDRKKEVEVLEAAYNDAGGVTAAFNLNLLRRMERELGASLNADQFAHQAVYDPEMGRIEMHLISKANQKIVIDGHRFFVGEGETIRTECSYKYDDQDFLGLAKEAGYRHLKTWTDEEELFSVYLLEVK